MWISNDAFFFISTGGNFINRGKAYSKWYTTSIHKTDKMHTIVLISLLDLGSFD